MVGGKSTLFGFRKNPGSPSLWFKASCEAWGEVSRESETQDLETLSNFLYFRVPCQSIVYQMGCDMAVSSPDQDSQACILGKLSAVSSSEQGKHVPWVLWIDEESWTERLYSHVTTRFVHFSPQSVDLKKFLYVPTCFGQVKILRYQIMFIPILLK